MSPARYTRVAVRLPFLSYSCFVTLPRPSVTLIVWPWALRCVMTCTPSSVVAVIVRCARL
jgi:hypothetical protein